MPLTAIQIRNAHPKTKPYKLSDERGLFLLVQPSGAKLWRFKYRANGADSAGQPKRVEKKLSIGTFPDVSLKEAREKCDEARRLVASGKDPSEERKRQEHVARVAATNSFRSVADAYIAKNKRDGLAPATVRKREWFLSLVDRAIGSRPISEIEPWEVLEAVRPYEKARNDEKAHRTLQFVGHGRDHPTPGRQKLSPYVMSFEV